MSSKIINIFLPHNAMPDFMRGTEFYYAAKKNSTQGVLIPQMLLLLLLYLFYLPNCTLYPETNSLPGASLLLHSLLVKSPSKSVLSVLPFHGSMHTKGTPFPTGDQRPNTGVSNPTVTIVLSSFTRLTHFIVLLSTI